jgi:hypothetical protein
MSNEDILELFEAADRFLLFDLKKQCEQQFVNFKLPDNLWTILNKICTKKNYEAMADALFANLQVPLVS